MSWFLFSTEGKRHGLPAKCKLLSRTTLPDGREMALVKFERLIPAYKGDEVALVPRGKNESLFGPHKSGDIVTVHIVDPAVFLASGSLDLAGEKPLDWGAIAFDETTAMQWSM